MKTKYLFTIIIICFVSKMPLFGQVADRKQDTSIFINNLIKNDTISFSDSLLFIDKNQNLELDTTYHNTDTIPKKRKKAILTSKVEYNSQDSTIYSIDGQKLFLFGKAEIKYQDITLNAGYIEVDMENSIIYAEGIKDSLGKISEEPIFVQSDNEIQAKSITYNLKTEKGYIKGLYTQQEEGYLHSEQTKKEPNNQINLKKGKYTTCELEDPHFYLWLSKGKVIPGKAIVSSYAFLVIEDVPLYPLMVPFGYFPSTKEKASGFLFPTFGEEQNRGFYLRNGGYYFAFSDYVDLALQGDVYSKGSWQVNAQSRYKVRYKFGGTLRASYSKVVVNSPTVDKQSGKLFVEKSNQYNLQWSHTQDSKARPNSNFNASVNFSSMDNNRYNSNNAKDYLTNTTSSSISFRKTFANTPFSMSANLRHSQNTQTKIIDLTLPQLTFSMNKVFPFKRKNAVGKAKWYEKIGINYSGNFENKSKQLHDSVMFSKQMWEHFSSGVSHNLPLSISLKAFKHFNISPSINFKDRMYFKRDVRVYRTDTNAYDIRTDKGLYNIYDYSFSIGTGTTLYGMYQFKSKWLKAIRHVVTPSVSMGYRPDFSQEKYGFYFRDTNESRGFYNPYDKYSIYGMPGTGKSGSVGFSLGNNLEMKVINKNDTTGNNPTKKIKLIDALSFSTSYNLIADSLNWSPISVSGRTTLFKKLGININATYDLYALDSSGTKRINTFNYKVTNNFVRLTNIRFSTGYTFKSTDFFGKKNKKNKNNSGGMSRKGLGGANIGENNNNEGKHKHSHNEYDYFDVPWSFNFNYSYGYSKIGNKPKVTQTLSFSGDFSLTPKWKINFSSGWDFNAKDFSHTSFSLTRDLHCWVASLNIIPFGERKSYSFTIGVKSAVLQDLKLDMNKSWYDNYAY